MPWAAAIAPIVTSEPPPAAAPMRIAASIAAVVIRLVRDCASTLRAMCRCVTCEISCASTPASSLSFEVSSSSPAFTPMKPPGSANALMSRLPTRKKLNGRSLLPSCARLESRSPSDCMYSLISGSSTTAPDARRLRITMRPMLYSSSTLKAACAAVPISGSWSWISSEAHTGAGRASQPVATMPASRVAMREGCALMTCSDSAGPPGFPGRAILAFRATRTRNPPVASARPG